MGWPGITSGVRSSPRLLGLIRRHGSQPVLTDPGVHPVACDEAPEPLRTVRLPRLREPRHHTLPDDAIHGFPTGRTVGTRLSVDLFDLGLKCDSPVTHCVTLH